MISQPLKDAYIAFCVVWVTVMLALIAGVLIYIFIDETIKQVKYRRLRRSSVRNLRREMKRLDDLKMHTTQADRYDGVYWIGPHRSTEYKPHFVVLEGGTIIDNFPEGVPVASNRNPE